MPPPPPNQLSAQDQWMSHSSIGVPVASYPPAPDAGVSQTPDAPAALAKAGSDKQSQEFQAAFQAQYNPINGHLAYTSVNAELAPHKALAARRDALAPTYQSALGQVDVEDPKKAKGAIDKVLGTAKALNAEVTKFRTAAEKAFNDWQSRRAKFDESVQHIQELKSWQDPKADALLALADGISKPVSVRKYAPACTTLDQLLPKLKPIYEEYLKQKAAKEKYEQALQALQPRLADASKSQYAKLQSMQADILAIQDQMAATAKSKDFVKALEILGILSNKVDTLAEAKREVEKKKTDYEAALAPMKLRLGAARPPHVKLDPMLKDIGSIQSQMDEAVKQDEYEQALDILKDLAIKLDTYETALADLEKAKKAYDEALAKVKPKLDQICQSDNAALAPMQEEIVAAQNDMEKAAKVEDYEQGTKLAESLGKILESYDSTKAGQIFKIIYKGKEFFGTMEELTALKLAVTKKAIEGVLKPLKNRAESYVSWCKDLKDLAEEHYVISAVVNTLGGASIKKMDSAVAAQKPALDALDSAISGDLKNAEAAYNKAAATVKAAGDGISEYMGNVESGGNRTITALQFVEVTCFAVGAAAGAALLAPVGAGMAATAGANFVAGAGFGALRTVSEEGLAKLAWGDADKINPKELVTNTIVSAVSNGAGAALGAVASAKLGGMVAEQVILKFGFKQAASKLLVQDAVKGSLGNTVQTAVSGAPDLIRGKTTWEQFAVAVAEAFVAGGIGGAIVGKLDRKSPLFKGLKDEEIDKAFAEIESGTGIKMPAKNLKDTELRFDQDAPIPAHDNTTLQNIKGAPKGWEVQVRRHSANANAPEGAYSRENPTTQVSAVEPAQPNETPAMRTARFKNQKYLLPDGSWKSMAEMTEAEKQAAHIH